MHHQLKEAELKDNLWLLRTGVTDMFYEKPSYASLRTIRSLDGIARGTLELAPLFDARPVSLETPKTVVSAALTAPTDDDVYGCSMGHSVIDGPPTAICHPCSEQRSEALDETSLIYTLILTTCQASTPFIHGAHFNGKQIYKLVKCGSREAAVAEAFHAASINGWNVVFSCVTRLGEEFDDRHGKVVRVPELWHLAQECVDKECIRIFY